MKVVRLEEKQLPVEDRGCVRQRGRDGGIWIVEGVSGTSDTLCPFFRYGDTKQVRDTDASQTQINRL